MRQAKNAQSEAEGEQRNEPTLQAAPSYISSRKDEHEKATQNQAKCSSSEAQESASGVQGGVSNGKWPEGILEIARW
jgi:hypothetical protein